ncbi:RNA-binding protein 41-like [Hyalella azteca]|uniref:RNA-binding protein 41-like n=1 Tax=Hyalella azteca TaxID=294128 RepID=A0A979FHP2_HYAAZ|nr:RNA-binding protein 41-like [Hyalella azteca]
MAQINYSSADFHRYRNEICDEAIISASRTTVQEQILQQCLEKFYRKPSDVNSYTKSKNFVASSSAQDDTNHQNVSGLMDCAVLKEMLASSKSKRTLSEMGVGQEEINILMNLFSNKRPQPGVDGNQRDYTEKLTCLLEKLSKPILSPLERFKESVVFEGRQEFEAAVRDGLVGRELQCQQRLLGANFSGNAFVSMKPKRRPAIHPEHPLNHLADVEQQLLVKKRRVQQNDLSIDCDSSGVKCYASAVCSEDTNEKLSDGINSYNDLSPNHSRRKTLWDVKETNEKSTFPDKDVVAALCDSGTKRKAVSKEFVLLPKSDELLPVSLIKEHCASTEEILKAFPNHVRGTPSNILYLKNLHKKVTPQDLASLFGNFDNGSVRSTYRLMKGRMRGQAFIKLSSVATATEALDNCQGFRLKGKPLIIEFGKKS